MEHVAQASSQITTDKIQSNLISFSIRVSDAPLLDFIQTFEHSPRVYFENEQVSTALAGAEICEWISATGPERFQIVRERIQSLSQALWMQHLDVPSEARPRWFGGFSFRSTHTPEGIWSAFPAAYFFLPRYQLARFAGQTWLTINDHLNDGEHPERALQRLQQEAQRFHITRRSKSSPAPSLKHEKELDYLMDRSTWHDLIVKTTDRIRQGQLEKVVLAQACRVRSAHSIKPVDVLMNLKEQYPNCYRFLIQPAPDQAFFGATPELLAEVDGTTVNTIAMASSMRRGQTKREDQMLKAKLMNSAKERHEHDVVVRAIENKLTPLMSRVDIPKQPDIVQLSNIQHLRTKIQGTLSENCGILPVIEALHPTPAMGGMPREVALQIIEREEPFQRGWYASPIGWIDLEGNGSFAVAIRSAISSGNETHLFAGAGIVANSDPQREWAEVQLKFRPILDALSAQHG